MNMEAHTLWSKDNLIRILTVSTSSGSREITVRRHYTNWKGGLINDALFRRGMLNEIVGIAAAYGGREDWRYFRSDEEPVKEAVTAFCKSARKAGFTCHRAIMLRGEPVGVSADDMQSPAYAPLVGT